MVTREQGGGALEGLFDDKVCGGCSESRFARALRGRRFVRAARRGKQLWLELDGDAPCSEPRALLVHLGMTGTLLVRGEPAPHYKTFKISESATCWPPKFAKFELVLSDGGRVAYTDPRRFGRVLLRGCDFAEVSPISDLAPDALDPPALEDCLELLKRRSAAIKAVLLDQGALVAGVGNWVADEVLYAAKVHPASKANALSREHVVRLREALVSVCRTACAAEADSSRFPENWLFHHRWQNLKTGKVQTRIGTVHFETVAGRTSAFVPAVQKRASALALQPAPSAQRPDRKRTARAGDDDARAVADEELQPPRNDHDDDPAATRRSTRRK